MEARSHILWTVLQKYSTLIFLTIKKPGKLPETCKNERMKIDFDIRLQKIPLAAILSTGLTNFNQLMKKTIQAISRRSQWLKTEKHETLGFFASFLAKIPLNENSDETTDAP